MFAFVSLLTLQLLFSLGYHVLISGDKQSLMASLEKEALARQAVEDHRHQLENALAALQAV